MKYYHIVGPKNIYVNKYLFSKEFFEIKEVYKYFLSIIIFIISLFFLSFLLTLSGMEFDSLLSYLS
jgi:trk system potassium uptake protein TrkH